MPAYRPCARRSAPLSALLSLAAIAGVLVAPATANSRSTDLYDAAVAHAGRPQDDLKRDPNEHPAALLRLAGLRPGMQVGDFMAADGYWSELTSYVVGPKGHVLLLNNPTWAYWSGNHWQERINGRLANVEHRTVDAEHLDLPDRSLDAMLIIKVYHDFYWIDDGSDPKANWPRFDVDRVLSEVARVLRPRGVVLLVDHSARAGSGNSDAGTLHRIDEAYARAQFEKHGFRVIATSDVLRRPDDARDQITYKGPMLGKTDRFVLVLRKTG
jgi:predicted methyltransferase